MVHWDASLHWDASGYYYQAIALSRGQLPFVNFVENKNPGIYYLLLPIAYLFKWNLTAPVIFFILINLANIVLSALLLQYFIKRNFAWYLSIFLITVVYSFVLNIEAPFMIITEVPELTFLLAGLLLMLRKKIFLSGIFFGLGFLMRQLSLTNLLIGLIILLLTSGSEQRTKKIAKLFLGFFIPVVIMIVIAELQGWLKDWFFYAFLYNDGYMGHPSFIKELISIFSTVKKDMAVGILGFLALLYPLTFVWAKKPFNERKTELAVVAFLFISGIVKNIITPGFHPRHFFDLFPVLFLIAGMVIWYFFALIQSVKNRLIKGVTALSFILMLLVSASRSFLANCELAVRGIENRNLANRNFMISTWIDNNTTPKDKIFVWGWAREIYLFSRRFSASRFDGSFLVYHMPNNKANQIRKELITDIEKNQPSVIVDLDKNFKNYYPYLSAKYIKRDIILPDGSSFKNVYVLK